MGHEKNILECFDRYIPCVKQGFCVYIVSLFAIETKLSTYTQCNRALLVCVNNIG